MRTPRNDRIRQHLASLPMPQAERERALGLVERGEAIGRAFRALFTLLGASGRR